MNKAKITFNVIFSIVVALAIGVIALYVYFIKNYKDFTLKSVQVGSGIAGNELSKKLEESNLENPPFIEFNELTNSNSNGERLRELRVSYLTKSEGIDEYSIYKSGMQICGDSKYNSPKVNLSGIFSGISLNKMQLERQKLIDSFAYYDGQNDGNHDEAWKSERRILTCNNNDGFILQVGDDLFCLKIEGKIDVEASTLFGKVKFPIDKNCTDLFYYLAEVAESSGEFGTFYLNLDLTNFFSVYKYNESSKKFEPISVDEKYEFSITAVPVKFTRSLDGYSRSSQSLFGCVNYNANVDNTGFGEVDIWNVNTVYDLSNKDFDLIETEEGCLLNLSPSIFNKIDFSNKTLRLNVKIDLSQFDKKVIGLNSLCLNDLPVIKLTITGASSSLNFKIKTKALTGTLLSSINVGPNINIDFEEGSTSQALEVIREN